ncbi:MAG: hypothetical protein HOO67_02780 [Candidatus Peribacteraceae bacterium]|nr:hypothetical protein [Candidatus Peribacteraceae bacterium]
MNAATGTYNFLANPSTWLQRGQNAWNAVATPVADAGRSVRGAVVDAPYQRGLEIDASRTAANLQPASTLFAHSDPGANGMMSAINVALQQNRQR